MKCIFSLAELTNVTASAEHIFPEAIGGTVVIQAVSNTINSRLGTEVDSLLTNHFLIEAARNLHSIKGKRGNVPNPFEGTATLETSPDTRVRYEFDDDGKPRRLYIIPSVVKAKKNDQLEVSFQCDASDISKLPEMVNKWLKRNGHTEKDPEELLKQVQRTKVPNPRCILPLSLALYDFFLPLLKIAYELTWRWIGDAYLNDPIAQVLRDAIWDKSWDENWSVRHPIRGQATMSREAQIFNFWSGDSLSHLGILVRDRNTLACNVRVFDIFAATVKVSDHAHLYEIGEEGRFIANHSVTGEVRESTLVQEFERLGGDEASLQEGSSPLG